MTDERIPVIYVSGLGRSGSTLLDMVVSASDWVFSVGEIYRLEELKSIDITCACGERMSVCPFWRHVEHFNIKNRVNLRDYRRVMNTIFNPFKRSVRYADHGEDGALFERVRNMTELPYILDSSKDIGRLMELDNNPWLKVYNISVIRDVKGTAYSFSSSQKWGKAKSYWVTLGKWWLVNQSLMRYLPEREDPSLTISYEELCGNPQTTVKKLERFLEITIPSDYVEKIRTMQYHNIGGNPITRPPKRHNFQDITYDAKWQRELPSYKQAITNILLGKANKRWVYGSSS